MINAQTQLVSLLGYPISHSLSPQIHNQAFQAQGINMVYLAFNVAPPDLPTVVAGFRQAGFAGSNVTLPHKTAIMSLLDELSPQAKAVGAVNTVVRKTDSDGKVYLYGDNTDVSGFIQPLLPYTSLLENKSFVVFGNGGAARAVLYALLTFLNPLQVFIVGRKLEKAQALAEALAPYDTHQALRAISQEQARAAIHISHLLVNTTPLGMYPNTNDCIWDFPNDFHQDHLAYDLIYNPVQTHWLKLVKQKGGKTIGGLEMFIGQAADSYQQWTHQAMPLDVVRTTLSTLIQSF